MIHVSRFKINGMHDIHLANKIQKLIQAETEKNKLEKVKIVEIELGEYIEHGADITADNLDFNLKMLCKGTAAEGAEFKINKVQGDNYWKLISISGD